MIMKGVRKLSMASSGIIAIIAIFLLISGCSTLKSKEESPTSLAGQEEDKGPSPLYYDLGDVLGPPELKVDKKSSFIYRTPGFSAGVLVLNGRVELSSLIQFFKNNMAKDNWIPVSSFKSPRTIMLFQKENRWCIINITEKQFNTNVEIWVAPTIQHAETGLLK
jgi:hypothetical protein